jgi:Kef-type K+ transport system membrane component KefB
MEYDFSELWRTQRTGNGLAISGVVFSGIFSHHFVLFKPWLSVVLGLFLIMLSR